MPKSQRTRTTPWGVWNLPNSLTIARLLLVPVFVVLLADGGVAQRWWALAVFVAASFTDQLDGRIARARGQITPFGTLADPIADKALTLGAFATLSAMGEIPWWITLVIAARELGITALRAVLVRRSIIPASTGGKIKTALQMLAIVLLVTPWASFLSAGGADVARVVAMVALYAALVVTVVTGADYVLRGWRLWRDGDSAEGADGTGGTDGTDAGTTTQTQQTPPTRPAP